MNLVGSTQPADLERHVADALAALPLLPAGARVVDLGSGAGFPGIPLAITRPDLDLTLVEIRERRVHFLRHVVRTLGLNCAIERRQIEIPMLPEFDFALLRAVAPPAVSAGLGRAWVGAAGEIWIWAGPRAEPASLPLIGRISLDSGGQILRFSPG
jgi:16S rRNA (guanine527-N7)-methyltransferase